MSAGTSLARRTLMLLGVIAVAAAAGYVVTCAVFPAPILPGQVVVPALRGQSTDAALARLVKSGLRGRLADSVPDPFTPAGTIAWQSPPAETSLPRGAVVRLGVSTGAPLVSMPDVTDLDVSLARQVIEAAGLKAGRVDTVHQDAPLGVVTGTVPSAGTTLHPGDLVNLEISSGPPSVAVPSLVGLTLVAARERLAAAGLRVGTLEQRPDGPAGTVLAQRQTPGELVTRESGVDLTIGSAVP